MTNKKAIWITGPLAVIIAICLCYFVFFSTPSPEPDGLTRGTFEQITHPEKNKIRHPAFWVGIKKGLSENTLALTVNWRAGKDRCVTLNGAYIQKGRLFGTTNPKESKERTLKINHRLDGRYIMDFHYFFPPAANRVSRAYVRTSRSGLSFKLKKDNGCKRIQIPIQLTPGDELTFSLEKNGFVIFSEPVFYPDTGEKSRDKPLVFVISVDTLRRDHVGLYNPAMTCTPEIDRFSADAAVFENAYSSSSWTLPAHISLFTGVYAHRHSLNLDGKKEAGEMKNSLFRPLQSRYINVSFNGSHFLSHLFGFARGVDYYHEFFHDTRNPFSSKQLFEHAANYIREDKTAVPLLFFLHTFQVHSTFAPEPELAKKFFQGKTCEPRSFDILELTKKGKDQFNNSVTPEHRKSLLSLYNAGIYTFDYRFGEFLRFLKDEGLYDRSMIVLLSDHGEEFMDHGGWEHGHSLYNELVKIPLIVKFPGKHWAGKRISHVVSIVDVLPTLLDWNRMDLKKIQQGFPEKVHGISLTRVLRGEAPGNRGVIAYLAPYACSSVPQKTAVISTGYKLIHNSPMTKKDLDNFLSPPPVVPRLEFFDLQKDSLELENLKRVVNKEFAALFKIRKGLIYKNERKAFPKELQNELKQLGYIN